MLPVFFLRQLLCSAFENDVEHARLKFLTIDVAFFNRDRVLDPVHRIVLVRISLEMYFCYEWLITRSACDEMEVCAAPKLWGAGGIRSIRNRANTLELILTRLGGDHAPAIAKIRGAV